MIYCEGGRSRSGKLGTAQAGRRPGRARDRRPGRPGRDPRLPGDPALAQVRLPEGHDPLRRAAQLRGRRIADPRAAARGRRRDLLPRPRDVRGAAARRSRLGDQTAPRRRARAGNAPPTRRSSRPSSSARDRAPGGSPPAGRCGRTAAARAPTGASCAGRAVAAAGRHPRAAPGCRSASPAITRSRSLQVGDHRTVTGRVARRVGEPDAAVAEEVEGAAEARVGGDRPDRRSRSSRNRRGSRSGRGDSRAGTASDRSSPPPIPPSRGRTSPSGTRRSRSCGRNEDG